MASAAPRLILGPLFFQPLRGRALVAAALIVWLAGASYCHGYQALVSPDTLGPWSGSLTWSAVAVVPWFALFEWSKQPENMSATRRPALLAALVIGLASVSIALEYVVDFCVGDVTDRLGLLVMRRLPAIGVTVLLIALTRRAMLREADAPAPAQLAALGPAIDWIEAADNYIEVHVGDRVIMLRTTMRAAERELESQGFVRIHRRYLVNGARIDPAESGDARRVRVAGKELPVGSRYLDRARLPATNPRR